jgi:hypothetical protein
MRLLQVSLTRRCRPRVRRVRFRLDPDANGPGDLAGFGGGPGQPAIYRRDRNSIESINRHLKDEERLRETNTRRLRGLASQQYLFAMIVTASNLRKIVRFITDRDLHRRRGRSVEDDVKTQRRRDREGWSNYKRWPSLDETTTIPPGP